jgi:ABC-type nitrate/sulfonate/bicarbonate transport system substrate-binding protein
VGYIDAGRGNQLPALLAGAVDAAVLSVEQRYVGLDAGLRELVYFGDEVKNSWGTLATSDRVIKERPQVVAGFVKAALKALRLVRQDRDAAIAAVMKFAGVERPLAARVYDDLAGTFTRNGAVDETTQLNDLGLIRLVAGAAAPVPITRAYDFSFAREADRQLAQSGWRP